MSILSRRKSNVLSVISVSSCGVVPKINLNVIKYYKAKSGMVPSFNDIDRYLIVKFNQSRYKELDALYVYL